MNRDELTPTNPEGEGSAVNVHKEAYEWIQCLVVALLCCVIIFMFFARVIDVVRTLAGEHVCVSIDTRHAGTARVSAINGVTRDLDIAVGVTRHDMEPGFYIVIVNNKSHKIAIK